MRIYYIAGCGLPSQKAHSVHIMKMCENFTKNGHSVTLFASGTKDVFDFYGISSKFEIEIIDVPKIRGGTSIAFPLKCIKKIRKMEKPDLLYSRHIYFSALSRKLKIPFIFELHDLPKNAFQVYAFKKIFRSKYLSKLIFTTQAGKNLCFKSWPDISKANSEIISNAADLFKGEISYKTIVTNCGYMGSLYTGRGVDLIIKLAEKFPDMKFHIAGGSPEEIKFWKASVSSENIFFHGHLRHAETQRFMEGMDVLLAPYQAGTLTAGGVDSTNWMCPIKLFEYLSTGLPIICSDFPVLREIIKDNENGIMVPPSDLEKWSDALYKLKCSKLRERLGTSARKGFELNSTWVKRVEKSLLNSKL